MYGFGGGIEREMVGFERVATFSLGGEIFWDFQRVWRLLERQAWCMLTHGMQCGAQKTEEQAVGISVLLRVGLGRIGLALFLSLEEAHLLNTYNLMDIGFQVFERCAS